MEDEQSRQVQDKSTLTEEDCQSNKENQLIGCGEKLPWLLKRTPIFGLFRLMSSIKSGIVWPIVHWVSNAVRDSVDALIAVRSATTLENIKPLVTDSFNEQVSEVIGNGAAFTMIYVCHHYLIKQSRSRLPSFGVKPKIILTEPNDTDGVQSVPNSTDDQNNNSDSLIDGDLQKGESNGKLKLDGEQDVTDLFIAELPDQSTPIAELGEMRFFDDVRNQKSYVVELSPISTD